MTDSVQLLRALADETRLRILALLARRELCVCQIVEVLDIGQSKASRHLAHLRNVRLVSDRREGPWIHYSLAEADGDLHRRMLQWLRQAENEIPMAASDAKAHHPPTLLLGASSDTPHAVLIIDLSITW